MARPGGYEGKQKDMKMKKVEQYMNLHQFLEADKKKVRDFLYGEQATDAYLTRTDLHYVSCGIPGIASRSQLGLQDNFM